MRINHNIASLNTYHQLSLNNTQIAKSLEKLSSGLRINRASDDAAGLAISEKMRQQLRGLDMAQRNAQDAISLIQTAEGAMSSIHSILQRMRELAVQAANDTYTAEDRANIQQEIAQLKEEIDRIADITEFNTQKLLDGSRGVTTTSSDLTGGQAVTVSATDPVRIMDGVESPNNQIVIEYDADGDGTDVVTLTLNLAEGDYTDLVSFTQAFNNALDQAATDLKNLGGPDITKAVAAVRLAFNVDADSGEVTFHLRQTSSDFAQNAEFTVKYSASVSDSLAKALGLTGDVVLTGNDYVADGGATQDFGAVSKDIDDQPFQWNEFSIRIEDGLNPTANQNNILKMTYDGLKVDAYIAEGSYTSAQDLGKAVLNAIVGVSTTNSDFTDIITAGDNGTIDGSKWSSLLTAAKAYGLAQTGTSQATGLIGAIDQMTDAELRAKGYAGTSAAMKESYLYALYKNGDTTLSVAFNSDNKLEISGPAAMTIDETSEAAEVLGLVDVNSNLYEQGIILQVGANANQTLVFGLNDMRTAAIGKTTIDGVGELSLKDVDVSTRTGAQNAIEVLDAAIGNVSAERAKLGAIQNRLEQAINNLGTAVENLTAAESRIRDVDMAREMMEFTKLNILQQSGTAMLAQANMQPQSVLQLLGRG